MKVWIKFISVFILNLLTINKFKVIVVSVFMISVYMIPTPSVDDLKELEIVNKFYNEKTSEMFITYFIPDDTYRFTMLGVNDLSTSLDDKHIGKYSFMSNNGEYFTVEGGEIKIRKIEFSIMDEIFHFLFVTCAFLIFLIIIALIIIPDSDDGSLEVYRSITKAKLAIVECELENGIYYYTVFDRLIAEQNYMVDKDLISWNFSTLSLLPKFKTKNKKRKESFHKLGI